MAETFDFRDRKTTSIRSRRRATPRRPPEVEEEEDARGRAASARYIVESEVGSEGALRDAMDPANQSLADALRLSFRVLQAVIVVLVVLFRGIGPQDG